MVIKFDDHGEKKFVTTMVMDNLEKSDRQPRLRRRAPAGRRPYPPRCKSRRQFEDTFVERTPKTDV